MTIFLFALVVVFAGAFAFLNGFRDASASVALAVRNRALTPTVAVLLAGFFNFIGAGLSAALALAVSRTWMQLPPGESGLAILMAGLISAVLWGIYTWWRGIPSSSTHALVGGLAGAGVASVAVGGNAVGGVDTSLLFQVALPLLLSPADCLRRRLPAGLARDVGRAVYAAERREQPRAERPEHCRGRRGVRPRPAGRPAHQRRPDPGAAGVRAVRRRRAAGLGGPVHRGPADRRDPGRRLADFLHHGLPADPDGSPARFRGADCSARPSCWWARSDCSWPISTTHTVTSAVLGSGSNQRFPATNRKVVIRVLVFWVLTPLVTAAVAFVLALSLSPLADL